METFLNQHELYFTPLSGSFEVERVVEAIKPIGLWLRDALVPSIFLIFLDEESRAVCKARQSSDPNSPLPYVLIIKVETNEIYVNQFAGSEYAEPSRAFLTWLAKNYPACRVRNEEETDLTAEWQALSGP
jgi:hypothetical protein